MPGQEFPWKLPPSLQPVTGTACWKCPLSGPGRTGHLQTVSSFPPQQNYKITTKRGRERGVLRSSVKTKGKATSCGIELRRCSREAVSSRRVLGNEAFQKMTLRAWTTRSRMDRECVRAQETLRKGRDPGETTTETEHGRPAGKQARPLGEWRQRGPGGGEAETTER